MAWAYQREESDRTFTPIPEGDYRIRVRSADKATSKNGRDMLALQFDVSGSNQILYHYIVFLDDHPEITNRMLTQFFDSFDGISEGDFNMRNWIGKVGACKVKHEEYNGNTNAKIHYFLSGKRKEALPPWQEPAGSTPSGGGGFDPKSPSQLEKADENGFMPIPEGDDGFPLF